jgi:hypothetical protein
LFSVSQFRLCARQNCLASPNQSNPGVWPSPATAKDGWRGAPGFPTTAWSATLLRPGTGALRPFPKPSLFCHRPRQMAVQTPKNRDFDRFLPVLMVFGHGGIWKTSGVASFPCGVAALPHGVDTSPRGVASLPRGVGTLPRGVTSRTLGVGASPPGVAAKTLGVDSSPRGVAGRTRRVDTLPRRVASLPRGVDGRIPGLCSASRF